MTQKNASDAVAPVTVIEAGPCTITQVKGGKDGYHAIQLGFAVSSKNLGKAASGHLTGLPNLKRLREFRTEGSFERGARVTVAIFKPGDIVHVTGVSKGKGFQGVVKRHGFHGSPKTHGHKDQLRMPGSIGAGDPSHVFKGKRMGGRMGGAQATVQNLTVVEVDPDKNLLYVKGAVPGGRNSLLAIAGEGELILGAAGAPEPTTPAAAAPEVPQSKETT